MKAASSRLLLLLVAPLAILSGCGGDYELNIEFEKADTRPDAPVYVDGRKVGRVADITSRPGGAVVRVVLTERDAVRSKIKPGILPTVRADGGIDIDASQVETETDPLPSGSTVTGYTLPGVLLKKYATVQTAVVVGVGLLALIIIFWLFRALFRFAVVLGSLTLACVFTWMFYPALVPASEALCEMVLPAGQTGQIEAQQPAAPDKATTAPATARPIRELVQQVDRPNPKFVAIVLTGLGCFVGLQLIFGVAFKGTRKKK